MKNEMEMGMGTQVNPAEQESSKLSAFLAKCQDPKFLDKKLPHNVGVDFTIKDLIDFETRETPLRAHEDVLKRSRSLKEVQESAGESHWDIAEKQLASMVESANLTVEDIDRHSNTFVVETKTNNSSTGEDYYVKVVASPEVHHNGEDYDFDWTFTTTVEKAK